MKKTLLLCALAAPLALVGCGHPNYGYGYGTAAPPPPAYSDIAQRGFHDGFDAARNDIAHGRRPDVDAHKRFRNPPVPPPAWNDYRQGFREGYHRAMHDVPPPAR